MTPQHVSLQLHVNGRSQSVEGSPRRTLLDVLREDLGITGPKYGCGMAQCGACTVLVDGAPARACVLPVGKVKDVPIVTLEGLADLQKEPLHPVQRAFVEQEGAQCGYCLNGMIMTAIAVLEREPNPTARSVREALRDNLCRCGTHSQIVASVLQAADMIAASGKAERTQSGIDAQTADRNG